MNRREFGLGVVGAVIGYKFKVPWPKAPCAPLWVSDGTDSTSKHFLYCYKHGRTSLTMTDVVNGELPRPLMDEAWRLHQDEVKRKGIA